MTDGMRVAFVVDRLAPGAGTENQLQLLCESLSRERVRPLLVELRPGGAPLPADVPRLVLGVGRLASPAGLRAVRRLAAFLRDEQVRVAVTAFPDATVVGGLAALRARVPLVTTRRNLDPVAGASPAYRALRGWLNARTAAFLANSGAAAEAARTGEGIPAARVAVVTNALRPRTDEPAGPREDLGLPPGRLVGAVGNLRPVKGHRDLLAAFARLEAPDVRLVIAGEGEERGALEADARARGLADRVHLLGHRDDVPRLLPHFAVFAHASHAEGSPNAVLEAQAAGVPVVATAVGGTRELLAGGERGLPVAPGDVEGLAAALAEMLADGDPARARARALRDTVRSEHDPVRVAARWADLLERVARGEAVGD